MVHGKALLLAGMVPNRHNLHAPGRWRVAAIAVALLATSPVLAQTTDAVAVHVSAGAITLDGRLDDVAWQRATPIHLAQQSPHPGAPTPYQSTVRVVVDAQHVYVGITNVDPNPDALVVHTLQRDHSQDNDDHVTIVLDTFGARHLGYFFQVNAGGARNDGLDVNDDTDNNWNGVWDAKVVRNDHGWTAEIVIPTQSLQFSASLQSWGLNVSRYVPRKQLMLRWSGITLDSDVFDLHRVGTLDGVGGLKQGLGLEVAPYAVARYNSAPGTARSGDVGADIKYHFTPQLTGIATINPDFAEAEAEQGRVNLSRFSLFFPEKRPFFLAGSNQFRFSHLLSIGDDGNLSTRFVPYFSRRIGLVDGHIVPIREGAKLIGHAGRFSLGALDVQTGAGPTAPATNLGVARAAYNVNQNLRVGTLMTRGDPTGRTDNRFIGVDSVWHSSHFNGDKNLTVSGWFGKSYGDLKPGKANGYGFAVQYPNDLWSARLRFNEFGDALDPALGYLPRPGTRQYMVFGSYQPRPQGGAFGWVRQFHFNSEYIQVDDLDGHVQSSVFMLVPVRFTTESGQFFNTLLASEYEVLKKPFTVADGVTIPAGTYRFDEFHIGWHNPRSQPLFVHAQLISGRFYTGTKKSVYAEAKWTTLGGKLQLGVSDKNVFGHLPQGNFIIRLAQLNAAYSFTPNLAVTTFVQYDTVTDTTGINLRLHWIVKPGSDLYVVLNHGIEPQLADLHRAPPSGNKIAVKLRWNFYR